VAKIAGVRVPAAVGGAAIASGANLTTPTIAQTVVSLLFTS
jgi:hypothetical protein